ncbi:MAG: tryptophan synthase subunit alpha [Armatimonadota bacterium]|nr:tryptophan synthase subunit alpha [Armatimonadota bacterium]MDR7438538.1 tryptophan synthase subunit alpha [Armatimonadota bacterium]MDR7562346.1 tryptophan synthase subunit alpha [Armatimonadota bacterium]MDR7601910.1 tryptophan synthase subunit alpha [Armatimonadota bacterium]
MSRFRALFEQLRTEGRAALMPFLEVGDPDLQTLEHLIPAVVEIGADALELGVPFSDPIADGPTMQRAAYRALQRGVRLQEALELVRRVRRVVDVPIAVMSYANPLYRYGIERFGAEAREAGVDGIIAADIPADEGDPLVRAARPVGLDTIFLVAPTSTEARLRTVAAATTGFLYCVSVTGVTGARERLSEEAEDLVRRVRRVTDLPAVVGFGIATPEHARAAARFSDGVIVASALYQVLEAARDPVAAAVDFLRPFARALRSGP